MSILLVDISNSRCKCAWREADGRLVKRVVPTADLSEAFLEELAAQSGARGAAIASVVPARNALFEAVFAGQCLVIDHRVVLGVAIDYPAPETIGADRLANATAAAQGWGGPSVVVDFGTAVTFDIVSAEKKYVGGVIAPGLDVMVDYLHERTALLPRVELEEPSHAIGKSTEEAIRAGAVIGYRGLIREILQAVRTELAWEGELPVVATGGYASLVSRQLPEISEICPDLTLDGIELIAKMNSAMH